MLASLTVFDGSGTPRTLEASGSLTYDAFGNLVLIGKIADPPPPGATPTRWRSRGAPSSMRRRSASCSPT